MPPRRSPRSESKLLCSALFTQSTDAQDLIEKYINLWTNFDPFAEPWLNQYDSFVYSEGFEQANLPMMLHSPKRIVCGNPSNWSPGFGFDVSNW